MCAAHLLAACHHRNSAQGSDSGWLAGRIVHIADQMTAHVEFNATVGHNCCSSSMLLHDLASSVALSCSSHSMTAGMGSAPAKVSFTSAAAAVASGSSTGHGSSSSWRAVGAGVYACYVTRWPAVLLSHREAVFSAPEGASNSIDVEAAALSRPQRGSKSAASSSTCMSGVGGGMMAVWVLTGAA